MVERVRAGRIAASSGSWVPAHGGIYMDSLMVLMWCFSLDVRMVRLSEEKEKESDVRASIEER